MILDREYVDYKSGKISLIRIDRKNDHFIQGKEYLMQMLLLSKCNSLVLTRCGGAIGAILFSGRIENMYTFELGNYGVYDKFIKPK